LNLKRRNFIQWSTLAAGTSFTSIFKTGKGISESDTRSLQSITGDIEPITVMERKERITKAQQLMISLKIDALIMESGSTLEYFTGVSW